MAAALPPEDLAHFRSRGWLRVRALVDGPTVAALDAETTALHERMAAEPEDAVRHKPALDGAEAQIRVAWEDEQLPGRPRRIRQLMNSELVCPTIERLLSSERILDIVAALMGAEGVGLYHSKLLMKAEVDGSFTPFHQDWVTRRSAPLSCTDSCPLPPPSGQPNRAARFSEPRCRQGYWHPRFHEPSHVNCMLAIDPMTIANGCVRFVDGSHTAGPQPHVHVDSASFSLAIDS